MAQISFINQTIQEHFKITEKDETENDTKNEDNNGENASFNQLLSLQLLIQRHSGLKELCKFILIILSILFNIYSHKRKR